jgi:MFS family permease
VRTFAKSDLLRTMSFVSIPALVAPMLGPIAGGLIVGYLHWRSQSNPAEMIHGTHAALVALGTLTIVSTIVFRSLKKGDGDDVSQHAELHAAT